MVKKINTSEYNENYTSGSTVIDFNATWCGPCKMLAPVLEEISDELEGKANFVAIDTDENPDLAKEFGIMSIPAVVVVKDGVKVDMNVGFVPKDVLKDFIESNI
ncbi:MAG: thioredoxin [Lachnospiraceae bacterium]|nr:thioredoxin [Lachnospiraceae bacterium]